MDELAIIEVILAIGGFLVVVIGGIMARDRALQRMIREGDEAVENKGTHGRKALHDKFDTLAASINRDFVRRSDIQAIQESIASMAQEMQNGHKDTNKRLDDLLHAMVKTKD